MANRWRAVALGLPVLAVAVLDVSGCSREDARWEETKQSNTIAAYSTYLRSYPDGAHAEEARSDLDAAIDRSLGWSLRALASDDYVKAARVLSSVLEEAPDNPFAAQHLAIVRAQEGRWVQADSLLAVAAAHAGDRVIEDLVVRSLVLRGSEMFMLDACIPTGVDTTGIPVLGGGTTFVDLGSSVASHPRSSEQWVDDMAYLKWWVANSIREASDQ